MKLNVVKPELQMFLLAERQKQIADDFKMWYIKYIHVLSTEGGKDALIVFDNGGATVAG